MSDKLSIQYNVHVLTLKEINSTSQFKNKFQTISHNTIRVISDPKDSSASSVIGNRWFEKNIQIWGSFLNTKNFSGREHT